MKHLIKTTLLLLALLLPTLTHAHDFEVNGIFYNINGTNATVTYKGTSYNSYSNEYSGSVTIPATVTYGGTTYSVTSIGENAFYNCTSLTTAYIGNSVTSIGNNAFWGCNSLTTVNIPNSVISIGGEAFVNCFSLTTINIPNSVTSIGDRAFSCCHSLTNINIPNSVTSIGNNAFYECSGLASISVASDNPKYDSRNNCNAIIETATNTLLAGCKNTIIPNSVTSIGNNAFDYCIGLTTINIPNSVTTIGDQAFCECTGLTTINIPNSVTSIGRSAFSQCYSLTTINIPNSVTSIGERAFDSTAWFGNQPDGLVYAGLVAYKYKGTMPQGTNITLKEGTKGIAGSAFYECTGLTTINIPNSVISIGDYAFYRCTGLTTINIPNSVTSIGNYAFRECTSLTTANIGSSVTSIGNYAFNSCTNLTNITIPNSVISIGINAFSACTSLTTINIPNSVTSIGNYAFAYCTGLTTINIPNSVTSIGGQAFEGCSGLASISVASDNPKYDSRNNCNAIIETATNTLLGGCKNTTIPNSVTSIGYRAFYQCYSLTTINIPNSVISIGDYAFYRCTRLTTINIPNSVTSIGDYAFYHCTSLNDIYCYATTPPECYDTSSFYYDYYSATLHVPEASLADYATATVWSDFENIVGDAVAPTGIAIRDRVVIPLNLQFELTATVTPDNASCKEVAWYSTDASVATVDNGTVTAVSIGECDIIASCMGISATCHIYVDATPGDVNGDGVITINDVMMMVDYLLGCEIDNFMAENADVNKDGQFSVSDITDFIDILLSF